MSTDLKKLIENQTRYVHISIPFYEEDFTFPFEDLENVNMSYPLVTENERWEATIDLKNHILLEWKEEYGFCRIFAKVRDEGIYTLLDKNKNIFCRLTGYVPNGVVPPKDGCGDYLGFNIKEDGSVSGWFETYDFSDFIESGKIITSEDLVSITNPENILEVIQNVFSPLSITVFHELNRALYPHFAYSGQFAYLSKGKGQEDLRAIDVETPRYELEKIPQIQKHIPYTKSLWLSYSVASPKQRILGNLKFLLTYHMEFEKDYYYMPIINKNIPYGTLPTESERNIIIQILKNKAMEMLNTRESGIVEF